MPTDDAPACRIVVSGDVVVDHHLYEGERTSPTASSKRGIRHLPAVGGAEGLRLLIEAIGALDLRRFADETGRRARDPGREYPPLREPRRCETEIGIKLPRPDTPSAAHHAFALWTPRRRDPGAKTGPMVWRASLRLGYGHEPIPPDDHAVWRPEAESVTEADLLVLDDAGFVFRNSAFEPCWHIPDDPNCPILLKLAGPVGQGDLWRQLVPVDPKKAGHTDQLTCLVSASDLRAEAALIGRGASWEQTLQDLAEALRTEPLAPLGRCRHLVITFGSDAALWLQPSRPGQPGRFCFAPSDAEGDFADRLDGDAVGYLTVMAGALAYGMSQAAGEVDLLPWMEAGLHAMRDLIQRGHGDVLDGDANQPQGFPHSCESAWKIDPLRRGIGVQN